MWSTPPPLQKLWTSCPEFKIGSIKGSSLVSYFILVELNHKVVVKPYFVVGFVPDLQFKTGVVDRCYSPREAGLQYCGDKLGDVFYIVLHLAPPMDF